MSLGPIMLDLRGPALSGDEMEMLQHPLVGGVILFSRNYESIEQITALTTEIHAVRDPRLLIAVDHEGGRVQRFREGFTHLPPCHAFGECYATNTSKGQLLAEMAGWMMAVELRAVGVDFSFAPVLDLYKGVSEVIGDRAFHHDPEVAALLAKKYMQGMHRAGMSAVGKHFPGHGTVKEDSHHAIPVDRRRYEDIQMDDLVAFQRLIDAGLPAIMPAHVIYPEVDAKPAGFSAFWLKVVLRERLGFKGVVFSDDISMAGAEVAGDYLARTQAALTAGCDMVLICNQQDQAVKVLQEFNYDPNPTAQARLMRMHGKHRIDFHELQQRSEWKQCAATLAHLDMTPELNLGDDAII